jgi:hypothetical protein
MGTCGGTAIRRGVMAARQPLKLEVQDRDLAAELMSLAAFPLPRGRLPEQV